MSKLFISTVIELSLLFLLVNCAFAQKTQTKIETFVFNDNLEQLPIGFKGQSVPEIYKIIGLLQNISSEPTKDEFETTADFEKRLAEFKKNQKEPDKKIVVALNYQLSNYDADKSLLHTKTAFTHLENKIGVVLDSKTTTTKYDASNAFGATTTVTKTSSSIYNLEMTGTSDNPVFEHSFNLDIPNARRIKDSIITLIVFELESPYISAESSSTKATYFSPFESFTMKTSFLGKILQIWFFDSETGKVLAKKIINK
ncbi:MAG TPA: hypothetical protein PKY59_21950 [Pyrinomonadaceae bacterium]|nr:hypothetical protein [Pyrinomonadaceae bacterium]